MAQDKPDNRQVVKEMLDHLGTNKFDDLIRLLTEDCVFHVGSTRTRGIVPWHGVHVGRDQIRGYLEKRVQYLHRDNCGFEGPNRGQGSEPGEGSESHVDKFIVDGDTVVVLGTLTDKFREESGDHSPMYTSDFVLVFKIAADGKIKKFQYFHDTDSVVQAWLRRYPGGKAVLQP
jgi:ketosteroid isomerase-like protein